MWVVELFPAWLAFAREKAEERCGRYSPPPPVKTLRFHFDHGVPDGNKAAFWLKWKICRYQGFVSVCVCLRGCLKKMSPAHTTQIKLVFYKPFGGTSLTRATSHCVGSTFICNFILCVTRYLIINRARVGNNSFIGERWDFISALAFVRVPLREIKPFEYMQVCCVFYMEMI